MSIFFCVCQKSALSYSFNSYSRLTKNYFMKISSNWKGTPSGIKIEESLKIHTTKKMRIHLEFGYSEHRQLTGNFQGCVSRNSRVDIVSCSAPVHSCIVFLLVMNDTQEKKGSRWKKNSLTFGIARRGSEKIIDIRNK